MKEWAPKIRKKKEWQINVETAEEDEKKKKRRKK